MKRYLLPTVAAGLLLLVGCNEKPTQNAAAAAPQAMPVRVFEARQGDLPITLEYPAKLISSGFVEVRAKVGGTLVSREYNEGSQVAQGALLFMIDPAKYRAAKAVAQAAFNQAEREYRRTEKLFAIKAISEKDRDTTLAAYESTKAALANATLDLDYTSVVAPIEGFAGQKEQNTGNLITAGTLLTTITKTNPLYAEFAFSNIEKLRAGYTIEGEGSSWANPIGIKVRVRGEDGLEFPNEGRIDFVDASIDRDTGSVKARAIVPNSRELLLPGQYVRIVLSGIVKKNAVRIPAEALMQSPQGTFVYIYDNGKAMMQPVIVENDDGRHIVLSGGLKEGDRVILDHLTKLRPGTPVMVLPANAPAPNTPAPSNAPTTQNGR